MIPGQLLHFNPGFRARPYLDVALVGLSCADLQAPTIGCELRFNSAFGIEDKPAFLDAIKKDVPPHPQEAARAINAGKAR